MPLSHQLCRLFELEPFANGPENELIAVLALYLVIDFREQGDVFNWFEAAKVCDNPLALPDVVMLAQGRPSLIVVAVEFAAGTIEQDFGGESLSEIGMRFVKKSLADKEIAVGPM